MPFDGPELVFYVLWAAATVAWLFALRAMVLIARERQNAGNAPEWEQLGMTPPASALVGTAEVSGHPAELSTKAAALLAKQGPNLLGPVKILEQTSSHVAFESLGEPV